MLSALMRQRLWALRTWLDSWHGIGHVAAGMHRQGFDLQLTQYDDRGWRATFYTTGMEHSPTSATGTAWERTPWRATQPAAWDALKVRPNDEDAGIGSAGRTPLVVPQDEVVGMELGNRLSHRHVVLVVRAPGDCPTPATSP